MALDETLLLEDWSVRPTSRTAFYLGQTYQCLKNWTHAYKWYNIRWKTKGNWHEEEYEARYRMAKVSRQLNQPEMSPKPFIWTPRRIARSE